MYERGSARRHTPNARRGAFAIVAREREPTRRAQGDRRDPRRWRHRTHRRRCALRRSL
jgi:hypothetical protein